MTVLYETLGVLPLSSEVDVQRARQKFAAMLSCVGIHSVRLDFLSVGFAELCRRALAAGQSIEIGLYGDMLLMRGPLKQGYPTDLSEFFDISVSSAGVRLFQMALPRLNKSAISRMREIVNFKSRDQLFAELERNRANLEKEVEQRTGALAASERQMRNMLESSPVAVRVTNRAQDRLTFMNLSYAEMLSDEPGKLAEADPFFHFSDPAETDSVRAAVAAGVDVVNRLMRLRTSHGNEIEVLASFIGIHYRNEDSVLGWFFDVTDLRRAKQVAEEATKLRSDFLANMSHEIRTPMNAIIGMTHLALQTKLTEKQANYLGKISGAANSLLRIINDILDFSKIEAGKLAIEKAPFSLRDMLDSLAAMVGEQVDRKGLELIFQVAPGTPDALIGDALRLGQVLLNLIGNAVKFTKEGDIVLSVHTSRQSGSRIELQFAVSDTGIGMSREQSARLFQPFGQADSSTTRKYGGTGLGLVISRQIVEMMDGGISLESEVGKGSTFSFHVWLESSHAAMAAKAAETASLRDLRVLVVDDNAASRTIFGEMLQGFGCVVTLAASGEECLGELERAHDAGQPIQLLLLDWKMRGMDGVQVSRMIRADARFENLLDIVMTTAYSRDDLVKASEGLRLNGLLIKPVTPSTMLEAVYSAFNRNLEERQAPAPPQEAGEIVPDYAGTRLLLVEDNELNQEVAQDLLSQSGFDVVLAENGKEALDALAEAAFDIVLMDIQMPVMDGYEATRAIRSQERFRNLPILAMTANAMKSDIERCLEAGMNDHIAKPVNLRQMRATLAKWVRPLGPARPHPIQPQAENPGLPTLAGIDTAQGLEGVGGNIALYRRLLQSFLRNESDSLERVKAALDSADFFQATRLAHTLKSVAGAIGAGQLASAAANLENACKSGSAAHLPLLLRTTEEQLSTVLKSLHALSA
ncbi:MAG TPA: response regulator [Burkholderiaceae bacterium]